MMNHDADCACENCESVNLCLNENQKKEREVMNMFANHDEIFGDGEQEAASQMLASSDDEGPEQDVIDLCTPPKAPKRLPGKRPMGAKRFLDLEAEVDDDDVPPSDDYGKCI